MSSQSDIAEKVRRLLALSKSSNINEAKAAASIANKYIVQYRLQEAELTERNSHNQSSKEYYPEPIFDDPEPMYSSAHVTPWKLQLASVLADHYGCALWNDKSYRSSEGGRNVSRFRLIGRFNDVKFTKYMFAWLVDEIQRYSDIECKGHGHTTFSSYCLGAVHGIQNLLRATRERAVGVAEQAGQSKAIARLNNRGKEAQAYMHRKYNLIQPAAPKPKFDSNAFRRGVDVGSYMGSRVTPSDEE